MFGAGGFLGAQIDAHRRVEGDTACASGEPEVAQIAKMPTFFRPILTPILCLQALHKEYQRLLGSVPLRRLNPVKMLESAFFSNKLVRSRPECSAQR